MLSRIIDIESIYICRNISLYNHIIMNQQAKNNKRGLFFHIEDT